MGRGDRRSEKGTANPRTKPVDADQTNTTCKLLTPDQSRKDAEDRPSSRSIILGGTDTTSTAYIATDID